MYCLCAGADQYHWARRRYVGVFHFFQYMHARVRATIDVNITCAASHPSTLQLSIRGPAPLNDIWHPFNPSSSSSPVGGEYSYYQTPQ